ncbi:chromate transporter [Curvibacter sp. PAE-UM]|uniref:chromate transporter n=1 Tax=Curvibacter sp. PAE-UM TaxID=1714344 RepID=UPI00070C78F4|nr:chromate transporter [Curvibacter sp. PAE-UM]KRI00642.1 chromate transporter [Curvibacter sp. PAE-UM]
MDDTSRSVERTQPKSLTDLFVSFTVLALQGFGGVLAVAQRELVERKRWFTNEEFVEEWAVAQIMPGPNIVNLAIMIGGRYFGVPGVLAALAGMFTAPLIVLLSIALLYAQYASHPGVIGALRGMGAVAAGLVVATGLRLASSLKNSAMGMALNGALGLLGFVAVALLRWPLVYVLLGLGSVACVLAYRKLDKGATA